MLSAETKGFYQASPRQIEDWHSNYKLKRKDMPSVMVFKEHIKRCNVQALNKAYQLLLYRHDILRTTFPQINGEIKQQIKKFSEDQSKIEIIKGNSSDVEIIKSFSFKMKDLKNGPLVNALLLINSSDEVIFVFIIHHIISDYWSLNLIKKELRDHYEAFCENIDYKGTDNSYQLSTYMNVQKSDNENLNVLSEWKEILMNRGWHMDYDKIYNYLNQIAYPHGLKSLDSEWRKINEKNIHKNRKGELYIMRVEDSLFIKLQLFKKKVKAGTFSILLAAFNLLCLILSGNSEVLIQAHFCNRFTDISEKLLGNLLGKVLIYNKPELDSIVRDYIIYCNQIFINSISRLIYNSEPLSRLGLSTRSFIFLNFTNLEMRKRSLGAKLNLPERHLNFRIESPLVCEIQEFNDGMVLNWGYHTAFFNYEMIQSINRDFSKVLDLLMTNPDDSLSKIVDMLNKRDPVK